MKIRLAKESDLPQLQALSEAAGSAAQWTQPQWLAIFQTRVPARLAWIAEGEIHAEAETSAEPDQEVRGIQERGIGFLVALNSRPDWELENIAVLPGFRRHGVGLRLLSALLSQAAAAHAERVLLEVRESNQSAIHFYTGSGFQFLAQRRGYYQHPTENALIMVHLL